MSKLKDNKSKIIEIFCNLLKEKRMTPTRAELLSKGISRDMIRNHFGTIFKLRMAAKEKNPQVFKDVIDETVFTPKFLKKIKTETSKYNKFVITTAVTGMSVHKAFYKNLQYYCKLNNAKLLILASSDPAAVAGFELDGCLDPESIVIQDLELNDNIFISTFKTSAKQINPLTGIKRIGQRERSMIVASPKQFLEYVPTANDKLPHAIMTTGALTKPNYTTERYMSQRTAYIAEFDHKLGAIIVEIKDKSKFHLRQIQAEYGTGFFIDLGKYYLVDKTQEVRPEALVLGDKHVGATDTEVLKATDNLIKNLNPKRIFFHDLFDGASVNHHEAHSFLSKANKTYNQLSLEQELKECADEINRMTELHPKVEEWIVNRSNHDEFLDRYLNSGDYIKDPINSKISHELALLKLSRKNVLEEGMKIKGLRNLNKIKFLKQNDSYKISGIEHGVHGHKGLNGQRNPSNSSLEVGYGAGVFGHSHSPGILRDVFRVGTSTKLRLGYNDGGASSWLHTHCLTYQNGSRQLINIIDGEYEIRKKIRR